MIPLGATLLIAFYLLLYPTAADKEVFEDLFVVEHAFPVLAGELLRDVESAMSNLASACTATTRFEFDSPYFAGVSFSLRCGNSLGRAEVLEIIQQIPSVGKAWPIDTVHRQTPQGPGHAVPTEHNVGAGDAAPALERVSELAEQIPSTHQETHVSRLHDINVTGAGIRIALVDSGFDTTVPGLQGTRVAYTRDLTTGATSVADNCSFHGTHVLGIIGANSAEYSFGVRGVAHDATYELYKIESCDHSAQTDAVIQAMIEAAHRGVDIISCSFGGVMAYPEEPMALTATRIMSNGTYVTFPAGNSGPGPFTGLSPGGALDIAAIGASDNRISPCYQWEGLVTMGNKTWPLWFTPGDTLEFPRENLSVWSPTKVFTDAQPANCSRIPDDVELPVDPSKSAMLVMFYQCWVDSKGVDIFKSDDFGGKIPYAVRFMRPVADKAQNCPMVFQAKSEYVRGVIGISWEDGRAIFDELSRGGIVTVSLPSNHVGHGELVRTTENTMTGGLMSVSSSWGPTVDGRGMPSFVAPGGNILSTFPARLGGWGVIGGTSMATPFSAGVAALAMQRHPQWSPAQVKTAISLTATPLRFHNQQKDGAAATVFEFLAPTISQGGGLVDAWAAAHVTTLTNVSSLDFNDTAHRPLTLSFTLTNHNLKLQSYTLRHIAAGSGYLLDITNGAQYNFTKADILPVYAHISIRPSRVRLGPGASAVISVSVVAEPALQDARARLCHFGGYISISSTPANESLTLPYTGIGGNLSTLPMINRDQTYMGRVDLKTQNTVRVGNGQLFICQYNQATDPPASFPLDGLYPGIQLKLVTQTRNLSIDLVSKYSGAPIFPTDYSADSSAPWKRANWWSGRDGNRTYTPPGKYFWRVKALRLNADPTEDKGNWDVWESAEWELRYTANSTGLPEPTTNPSLRLYIGGRPVKQELKE